MRGIIFSDLHLHTWPQFNVDNVRLRFQLSVLEKMMKLGFKNDVPVFFGGDFFHQPVSLDNDLLSVVLPELRRILNQYPANLYAITGNHDVSKINSIKRRSPSYINTLANTFKNFKVIDFDRVETLDYVVHGVPYIHFNEGLMDYINSIELSDKFNILLLHTDFRAQRDTNGIVIGKGEGISEKDLSRFDLVVSGHVHKAAHLRKNIYSIGAPMQQRVSDMGGSFGYWIITNDLGLKFRKLKGPEFRYYTNEEDITDDYNYWVKENISREESSQEVEDFLDLSDRKRIIRNYLKAQGVVSKSKRSLLINLVSEIDE